MAKVSWLQEMLPKLDAARSERPETTENLVQIPNGVERLKNNVLAVRKQLRDLQLDRAKMDSAHRAELLRYQEVIDALCKAYDGSCAKNDVEVTNAHDRLVKLWQEWIKISKDDIGVYAALPGAELPEAPPLPTVSPDVVEAEWSDQEA